MEAAKLRKVLALLDSREDFEGHTVDSFQIYAQQLADGVRRTRGRAREVPAEARERRRDEHRTDQFVEELGGGASDLPFTWERKWSERYRRWGSYDDLDKALEQLRAVDPDGYCRLIYRTVRGNGGSRWDLDYERFKKRVPFDDPAAILLASFMPDPVRVPPWADRDVEAEQAAADRSVRGQADKAAHEARNLYFAQQMLRERLTFEELAAATDLSVKRLRKLPELDLVEKSRAATRRVYAIVLNQAGASIAEIASVLDVSEATARRLVRTATFPPKEWRALRAMSVACDALGVNWDSLLMPGGLIAPVKSRTVSGSY